MFWLVKRFYFILGNHHIQQPIPKLRILNFHQWDVKNGFAFVLQLFSLISGGLGGVIAKLRLENNKFKAKVQINRAE